MIVKISIYKVLGTSGDTRRAIPHGWWFGELTNGRLAMMAFVGMVIQTLLFDKPLMDMHM